MIKIPKRDAPADFLHDQSRPGGQSSGLCYAMFEVNGRAELFAGAQKILRLNLPWGLEG
jgi:hypothetical protein